MRNIISKYNIKTFGNGSEAMIFAHGLACNEKTWQYLTPYFEEKYKIILFDYMGSGESDKSYYNSEKYSTLDGYVEDLEEILTALRIKNAIFVGHSVSAMIGMRVAINMPDRIKSLIMLAPSPRYLNSLPDYHGGFDQDDVIELLDLMEINFSGWVEASTSMFLNTPEKPELAQVLAQSMQASDPVVIRQFAGATFFSDSRNYLKEVKQPVLIVQCALDSIVPVDVGKYMERQIMNCTLITTNIKGHYPHLTYPEETSKIIKSYLADQAVINHG